MSWWVASELEFQALVWKWKIQQKNNTKKGRRQCSRALFGLLLGNSSMEQITCREVEVALNVLMTTQHSWTSTRVLEPVLPFFLRHLCATPLLGFGSVFVQGRKIIFFPNLVRTVLKLCKCCLFFKSVEEGQIAYHENPINILLDQSRTIKETGEWYEQDEWMERREDQRRVRSQIPNNCYHFQLLPRWLFTNELFLFFY